MSDPEATPDTATPPDHAALRALAEAAIPGFPLDRTTGEWEPYFNYHGDPFVALAVGEKGRGGFGHVTFIAQVGTEPEDYGRARAEFIAAACPATVLRLLDRIEELERAGYETIREGD